MSDNAPEPGKRPRSSPPSATIDVDQILEFIRLGNERRSDEIALMAERLAQTLAEQIGEAQGREERLDEGRIRAYDITRRQLAGPFDDEAGGLGAGAIVSVTPPTLSVGSACSVLLRDAGRAVEVAFASDDGTVAVRVTDTSRGAGTGIAARSYELVTVEVPAGAITGPITVVTDAGILTSTFDAVVAAEAVTDHLADEDFMAPPPWKGEQ
jgi:hypothetical protein